MGYRIEFLNDMPTPIYPEEEEIEFREATVNTTFDKEKKSFNHLLDRLWGIKEDQVRKARKTFHLDDDEPPVSFDELLKRLEEKRYTIPDEKRKASAAYSVFQFVRWRDPAAEEDPKGYYAAREQIDKDFQSTQDSIYVKSGEEALFALQKFEKATYN